MTSSARSATSSSTAALCFSTRSRWARMLAPKPSSAPAPALIGDLLVVAAWQMRGPDGVSRRALPPARWSYPAWPLPRPAVRLVGAADDLAAHFPARRLAEALRVRHRSMETVGRVHGLVAVVARSEEHTSELQSPVHLV